VPLDLTSDEAYGVRLSQRAVDSFRFHHGGSDPAARSQLHAMLEDFLLSSARRVNTSGTVTLARSGYILTLSPRLDVVVGYRSQHRERTWEQVRAGVKSRFGKAAHPPHKVPEGPPVESDALRTALDPVTCVLTARARTDFDRLLRDGVVAAGPDAAEREAALRDELRRARDTGTASRRPDGVFEIAHLGRRWVVTPNALGLLGIGVLRSQDDGPQP
jgi:plasmid stabilization system protein ParE